MFARVFGHARRLLTRSPSLQDINSDDKEPEKPKQSTPRRTPRRVTSAPNMVTSTRRGPIEDRSTPSTPRSSARKTKRQLEAEDTPTGAKKRRTSAGNKKSSLNEVHPSPTKSPAKTEDKPEDVDTQPASSEDTPDAQIAAETKVVEELPLRERKSSPQVAIRATGSPSPPQDVETGSNTVGEETSTTPDNIRAPVKTPAKQKQQKASSMPRSTRASAKMDQKQGAKVDATSEEVVESPVPVIEEKPQNTKIRFGSEEPAETETSTAIQVEQPVVPEPSPAAADDYESDSDEAPEEVTVATAKDKVLAAEEEVARAIKAAEEKQERKKQEQAERKAEEQRLKQERVAEEEKIKAKKEARKAKKRAKWEASQAVQQAPPSFLPNYTGEIPALLPESLLEAVGDRRPPTPPTLLPGLTPAELQKEKLKRHIRFLERGEKPIKDVKKGSLSLRVLKEHDVKRAPKVNKGVKNIREKWLKNRHRAMDSHKKGRKKMEFKKVERRAVGGGFLRGED